MPSTALTPPPAVTLSERDSAQLYQCVHRGHASALTRTRAQALRKLGGGWSEAKVCPNFDICLNAVKRIRQRRGVEQCVVIQPQLPYRVTMSKYADRKRQLLPSTPVDRFVMTR